jgi:ABC-2 type transport system ATP-binding protein
MELADDLTPTVVLSSHLLSDVERVCDYLIVLADGQVRLQGAVDDLLADHKVLTGPRRDVRSLPTSQEIVRVGHTDRQTTVVIRTTQPVLDPRWVVSPIGLEELVLAYMTRAAAGVEGAANWEVAR